jgi:UDP-glucose 4-epimerase
MQHHRRALVTGGAGFIGSELVRQLLAQGDEVVVIDNLVNGRMSNLDVAGADRLRLVVADIRDRSCLASLLPGIDVLYHLACLGVRHSVHAPAENHDVNATATLHLLMQARAAGVKRFVHVSSSEVYGTARFAPMTEEHPTFPETVYGASKLAGECVARAFHRTYGYATVVVRPFNAFGPRCHHEGDSGEVIPKFLLRCLVGKPLIVFGEGTQTRDFTFVADTARGIALAGTCEAAVGKTINLGSGHETSINALAEEVGGVCGQTPVVEHIERRPGDVLRLCADSTLARELLGFEPRVSLREGLARLRDWYVGLGQSPEELLEQEVVRNWQAPQEAGHAR